MKPYHRMGQDQDQDRDTMPLGSRHGPDGPVGPDCPEYAYMHCVNVMEVPGGWIAWRKCGRLREVRLGV